MCQAAKRWHKRSGSLHKTAVIRWHGLLTINFNKMGKNRIQFETKHWGKYYHNVETLGYKALVITGAIQGQKEPRFGRVVQIRKKSGAYGSDTVLLRESDGSLQSYHNMGFFSVAEEFLPLYENAMKEADEKNVDSIGDTYDIMGKNPAKGFIVEGLDDTDGKLYSFAITVKRRTDASACV